MSYRVVTQTSETVASRGRDEQLYALLHSPRSAVAAVVVNNDITAVWSRKEEIGKLALAYTSGGTLSTRDPVTASACFFVDYVSSRQGRAEAARFAK